MVAPAPLSSKRSPLTSPCTCTASLTASLSTMAAPSSSPHRWRTYIARCSIVSDAVKVFDKMPKRDVAAWIAVSWYMQNGECGEGLRCLVWWRLSGRHTDDGEAKFTDQEWLGGVRA
ncbi:uncharacterized protein LOC112878333 [Panicum hallii]|uniref:uncharacterized protein LOC112878333 n=1 Tax=Panicum hallii TaxID=206008 RepID=UPI000DF4D3D2|nr:uncharacterized protein LOC112878333 [Panicum hallii]